MNDPDPPGDPQKREVSGRGEGDTDISALSTREEIDLELGREEVRLKREERRGLKLYQRGLVTLMALLTTIALASIAVFVTGLLGDHALVLPSLGVLFGSGTTGALLWRSYAAKLMGPE